MTKFNRDWEQVKPSIYRSKVGKKEYEYMYRVKQLDALGKTVDTWRRLSDKREPFRTMREAEAHRTAFIEGIMNRTEQSVRGPKMETVGDVFRGYMENRATGLSPNTISKWNGNMENHVIPYFKDRNIKSITVGEVKNFVLQMRKKYAWSTVNNMVTTMGLVWQYGREMGVVSRETYLDLFVDKGTKVTVSKKMPGEQDAKKVPVIYTDEQLERFYEYAERKGTEYYILLLLCYLGGVRLSEALGLCWSDIDWGANEIRVERQLTYDKESHKTYLNTTKCQTTREFAMHPKLKEALLVWQSEQRDICRGVKSKQIENHVTGGRVASTDFILCRQKGITTHSAANHFRESVKKNVDDTFFYHGLRHTIISNLCAAGVPIKDVSVFIGHADLNTTIKNYLAPTAEGQQKLVTALQSI